MKDNKGKRRNIILSEESLFSLRGFSELQWYIALISVLAVLLTGWTSIMGLLGFNVSMSNIVYIHRFFFVWIFDIAVVSLVVGALYILNFKRIRIGSLKRKIKDLEGQIENSIDIAEEIRSGHDIPADIERNSKLARTLVGLGNSLHETTEKERQFSWVTKGKETISDTLRKHTNIELLADETTEVIVKYYRAAQGAFYLLEGDTLRTVTQYAYDRKRYEKEEIKFGHGLIGAAAYEKQLIYRTEIPDDYFTITSGLINVSKPKSLLIIPLVQEEEVQGVIELSFFADSLPKYYKDLAEEVSRIVGSTLYNLKSNVRTEKLLRESQEMTATLRQNEETLHRNAQEMLEAKENLEKTNSELAKKMAEVELATKKQDAMLRNASEFISIYNRDRELEYESPSLKRILGYDPEDDIHGMDEEFMSPRSWKKIGEMFDYLLQTPGGEMVEQYTYLKKNGKKIFLETQGKNLLHDPAIRGLIFNTRDVTERERAKKEEKMKSRMQSLSENSPDIIIRTQTSGKVAYANPAASRFVGVSVTDMMNRKIDELVQNEDYKQFLVGALKIVKRSREQEVTEIKIDVDGEEHFMECKAIPEVEDDTVESVLFTAHDVTAIKRLEQEAQKAKEDVMGSINYAFRIQRAILPKQRTFSEQFPGSFMFYRPKNIVSGDFPWFYQHENTSFFAAVDCTGHGVPGALLSFIGYLMLSKIVEYDPEQTAADILNKLHAAVRHTLKQDTSDANAGDGMDLALIRVDKDKHQLQYSGAHRPMYYMHMNAEGGFDEKFQEYEGTRKGIGGKPLPGGRKEKEFENHVIDYEVGDRLYIFSDGLPDQLGGPEHKKFFTKQVKAWLGRNLESDMISTKRDIVKDFYNWRGLKDGVRVDYSIYDDFEEYDKSDDEEKFIEKQVDDVLLLGIQL